jgi:transposase
VPPGVYFRMLFVGYFEGLGSQRGIAWRCADSLASRQFLGIPLDEPTPEANAGMKSIVQRDTGEDWKEYVTQLMREEGAIDAAHEPTAEEVRRFDKKRKNKKVSNEDWKSSTDGDARITQMKDGTTHLAYKAEHVVDLKSDLILAAEIYPATQADPATLADSVVAAQLHLKEAGSEAVIEEAAADMVPRGRDDRAV